MRVVKHKQASVKLNGTSVVIYYSYKGEELRYPTGIKISPEKDKSGKHIYWDDKNSRLKIPNHRDVPTYQLAQKLKAEQKAIDEILGIVNNLITKSFTSGLIISPRYLKMQLDELNETNYLKANIDFFDYFIQFLERKKIHFNARGNIISLKDYTSTKLLLDDYQNFKGLDILISHINNLWLEDFVIYMSNKHPDFYGDHKVSSKGEMANSTILKRLNILTEFFTYLFKLNIVTINEVEVLRNFKKTIKKKPTSKETLDINEIHKLYEFKFGNKELEKVRDLFVFLCLTGIRYQDLFVFDKKFIKPSKQGDGLIYQRKASKTSLDYNIPLCKIVIEILYKYKYELPKISDQYGNKMIKEVLKETKLFNAHTQIIDKETKQYKKRFEAITLHKGRNSFITNLVDTTPLNELMKYTGHKKLSTLQSYIDASRPVKMDYITVFDKI